ncbi:hypothetical protein BDQ17DRAFT_1364925, partial [Cyathus striatus]
MRFLQGPEATAAGLVYLQDEEYTFQVKEGGRRWSVYGSPVRIPFPRPSHLLTDKS